MLNDLVALLDDSSDYLDETLFSDDKKALLNKLLCWPVEHSLPGMPMLLPVLLSRSSLSRYLFALLRCTVCSSARPRAHADAARFGCCAAQRRCFVDVAIVPRQERRCAASGSGAACLSQLGRQDVV